MIICIEMTWRWLTHTQNNANQINALSIAFPNEKILVMAERDHLLELERLCAKTNKIGFCEIDVPMELQGKTHIVSLKRFWREFRTIRNAISMAPANEKITIVMLSATSTAIAAASLVSKLTKKQHKFIIFMHGNLNEIDGWRSRNPFTRKLDMKSMISTHHGPSIKFVVLENAIKKELVKKIPEIDCQVEVISHCLNNFSNYKNSATKFEPPFKFGLIGQATADKGLKDFLFIAGEINKKFPGLAEFYLCGRVNPGELNKIKSENFLVLAHKPDKESISPENYAKRIMGLHFAILQLSPKYYSLSASGGMIDAISSGKPIIGGGAKIVLDLFEKYGDIGYVCETLDDTKKAIETIITENDVEKFLRQKDNLEIIKKDRNINTTAIAYKSILER